MHAPTVGLTPVLKEFDSTRGEFRYAAQRILLAANETKRISVAGARYVMIAGTNKDSGAGGGTGITTRGEYPLIRFGDANDFFPTRAGDWFMFSPIDRITFRNILGANDISILIIWSNDPFFRMFDIAGVFNDRGVAQ